VLEAVPQLDERDELAGDVAVLAPCADLVVVELGIRVGERGRLRVLVHIAFPPVGRHRPDGSPAVDQRNGAPDLASELPRGVRGAFDLRAALIAALRELRLRAHQHRVRAGREPHAVHDRAQGRDQRADRGTRQESRGAGNVKTAGVARDAFELAAARDGNKLRALLGRAARHRECLLGSARVRHGERQRVGPDECGRAHLLQHADRHRHLVVERRRDDVARDSRAPHAEHHDVSDRVGPRQRVGVHHRRRLVGRRQLLRQPRDRIEEVETVGHFSGSRSLRPAKLRPRPLAAPASSLRTLRAAPLTAASFVAAVLRFVTARTWA
jgi:hypothetical protein